MATEDEIRMLCLNAASDFAVRCKELKDQNSDTQRILEEVMIDLVPELWDRFFSQSEIKTAFERALAGLALYAADEERRGDKR
ncbi:hypothetical protein [Dongia sedimenti]|uniref:Uncharacterized protein n=1 Tax=Dongia sedimenti TaxID=3064282 RepID=A0ABU0YHV1_9PROT|nr:hypothetical protein [Rhodospirillaceae bacterium R-7]